MSEFLEAARQYPFLRYALAAGLLASVACGIVGTYVVVRRITYIAASMSHCVLGGMGAALYLQRVRHVPWCEPLYGAVAAALLAALVIGLVSLRAREREDTVIGAIWAVGMAVGVLFIARTPGYNADLMSYLFGNILMVSKDKLWLMGALDAAIVAVVLLFHRQLQAICFDEEFARLRGVRVEAFYLLLLVSTALTVVLLVTIVGIVMVIALLTLPVAVAGHFARSLWQMMGLSILLSVVFTTAGLALSYSPDLPAGATIIVLAGAVYLIVAVAHASFRGLRAR
ncbi:MAG: metal ABC transporter permease [Candidatus Sumerlaeota bacterium]|nr:metal ABC transporter permease [Candidatus Sumerlaeota bacterium]